MGGTAAATKPSVLALKHANSSSSRNCLLVLHEWNKFKVIGNLTKVSLLGSDSFVWWEIGKGCPFTLQSNTARGRRVYQGLSILKIWQYNGLQIVYHYVNSRSCECIQYVASSSKSFIPFIILPVRPGPPHSHALWPDARFSTWQWSLGIHGAFDLLLDRSKCMMVEVILIWDTIHPNKMRFILRISLCSPIIQ